MDGKLFVCYIGLIYLSYIKNHMQTAGLFKDYTMQGLIDCLDVIECFEYPNQSLKAGKITEKQKQLYKILDINPHKHSYGLSGIQALCFLPLIIITLSHLIIIISVVFYDDVTVTFIL